MAYTSMKEVEGLLEKLGALESLVRDLQAEVAELKAAKASKAEALESLVRDLQAEVAELKAAKASKAKA